MTDERVQNISLVTHVVLLVVEESFVLGAHLCQVIVSHLQSVLVELGRRLQSHAHVRIIIYDDLGVNVLLDLAVVTSKQPFVPLLEILVILRIEYALQSEVLLHALPHIDVLHKLEAERRELQDAEREQALDG